MERLASSGIDDLGFARLDTDRTRRTGMAEVIFAPGKTEEQLAAIVARCLERSDTVLVTRLPAERAAPLLEHHPQLIYNLAGRVLSTPPPPPSCPPVAVVSAGTSDQGVAEEAAAVLEHLGHPVDRVPDVGVAGIHRLFSVLERLRKAHVLVVAAGMEGALPSVVAGLVDRPVVAVPTSVGYGASFGGVAALLGMLNSCAAGIGVVNIDNGFGAATLVHRIAPGDGERS
ncbi:MAG: nickel pincer cofactor biosynthesis protein LarB [Thermoanaerobaculales bacterium]|nr:nickel pincer cofactor biosynthesis protein LarB [Thermoanaerobaculales bacterium]